VKDVMHNEIDATKVTRCPYCGSQEFATQIEWGDEGYKAIFPEYEGWTVPVEPSKYEWVDVNNDNIKGKIKVPVFDVSSISEDEWHTVNKDFSDLTYHTMMG